MVLDVLMLFTRREANERRGVPQGRALRRVASGDIHKTVTEWTAMSLACWSILGIIKTTLLWSAALSIVF